MFYSMLREKHRSEQKDKRRRGWGWRGGDEHKSRAVPEPGKKKNVNFIKKNDLLLHAVWMEFQRTEIKVAHQSSTSNLAFPCSFRASTKEEKRAKK